MEGHIGTEKPKGIRVVMSGKIKILFFTYSPWDENRSMGETYSNIFGSMLDRLEVAHLFFSPAMPDNPICFTCYNIPYNQLLYSAISGKAVGGVLPFVKNRIHREEAIGKGSNFYGYLRKTPIFSLMESIFGYYGHWDTPQLSNFISAFSPDLILYGTEESVCANRILQYIHRAFRIPIVSFLWDECFSLTPNSFWPSNIIKNIIERCYRRRCIVKSDVIFTISEKMRDEYSELLGMRCVLLNKGHDISVKKRMPEYNSGSTKIVYLGTLCNGRLKTLAKVCKCIQKLNNEGHDVKLDIYTISRISSRIIKELETCPQCVIMPFVHNAERNAIMEAADMLLHIEPLSRSKCKIYRLSLSSKIVDYLYAARCILAVGGRTGTMEYLNAKHAAVVENDAKKFYSVIKTLISDKRKMRQYAANAWECCVQYHDIRHIRKRFLATIEDVIARNRRSENADRCVNFSKNYGCKELNEQG